MSGTISVQAGFRTWLENNPDDYRRLEGSLGAENLGRLLDGTLPAGALDAPDQAAVSQALQAFDNYVSIPLPTGGQTGADFGETLLTLQDLKIDPVGMQGIATLMFQLNLDSRKTAREDRADARDANMASLQRGADDIRKAAICALVTTVVQAGVSIAGAVINIALQAHAIKTEAKAQAPQTQAAKLESDVSALKVDREITLQKAQLATGERQTELHAEAKYSVDCETEEMTVVIEAKAEAANFTRSAQSWSQWGTAAQTIGGSVGQLLGAVPAWFGADYERDKALAAADAEKQRAAVEDETAFIQAYQENLRKVLEVLQAAQQAESDTNRTILRG